MRAEFVSLSTRRASVLAAMFVFGLSVAGPARAESGYQTINGTRVFTEIDRSRGVATFSNDCGSQTLTQRQLQAGAIPDDIIPCPRRRASGGGTLPPPSTTPSSPQRTNTPAEECIAGKGWYDRNYKEEFAQSGAFLTLLQEMAERVRYVCPRVGRDDLVRDLESKEAQRTGKRPSPSVAARCEGAQQEEARAKAALKAYGDRANEANFNTANEAYAKAISLYGECGNAAQQQVAMTDREKLKIVHDNRSGRGTAPTAAVTPQDAARVAECQRMATYLKQYGETMGSAWQAEQLAKGRCTSDGVPVAGGADSRTRNIGVEGSGGATTCPVGYHLFAPYGRPAVCQPNRN